MHFDWTITLGNVISTLTILLMFIGGAWKLVANHLHHLDASIKETSDQVKSDLIAYNEIERSYFSERFTSIESSVAETRADIRELRSYVIPYKADERVR